MARKIALSMGLAGSCVWCLALVSGAGSDSSEEGSEVFTPVAAIHSLMHGQKTFFKEIGQALQTEPAAKRNEEIHDAAEVLAELANVNRLNKDKDDYRNWARQLRDTCLELAREAGKKEAAENTRMKALFEQIKATCASCHDVYQ